MKTKIIYFLFLFSIQFSWSQNEFYFDDDTTNKISIDFKLINNLIVFPIEVNGVSLNFILDSGVEETILFSLDETDEVKFLQIEKISLRGFGKKEAFDGYKSINNVLNCHGFKDDNHTIYLVLDQNISISSQIGVPINGIIGYKFFKNNLVKINYTSNKITIYKNSEKQINKISKSYSKIPLQFNHNKPYVFSNVKIDNSDTFLQVKLLLDTGNSDAIWLFKTQNDSIKIPNKNFEDYLGRAISGEVFGKRARISSFKISEFEIKNPLVAFPENLDELEIENGRLGSIGAELIKRFTVFFDYKSKFLYLKKNSFYNEPFNFNMSGIEVQHLGLFWINESYEDHPTFGNNLYDRSGEKITQNLLYKFVLKPQYIISNVRKNSSAEGAGLKKDDIILKINHKDAYNFTLEDINELLKSEDGKIIEMEIERKKTIVTFKFQLKDML